MPAMYDFSVLSVAIIIAGALIVGVSKTGIPGLGILIVPVFAMAMPARQSTGFVLPMLCVGDLIAVIVYRRKAVWKYIVRVLPFAMAGIVIGFFTMRVMSDKVFKPFLASSILVILALDAVRRFRQQKAPVPGSDRDRPVNLFLAALAGILAGFFTMMANAAGPIMVVYLLAMGLPKEDFVGTSAWFYFFVNLFKLPFSAAQGLITLETLKWTGMMVPVIIAGGFCGIALLKKLSEKGFQVVVEVLAAVGALKLFF